MTDNNQEGPRIPLPLIRKGVGWLVGLIGWPAVIVLLFAIPIFAMMSWTGGGSGLTGTGGGSPAALGPAPGSVLGRVAEWLPAVDVVATDRAALPNAVFLAVMSHESGGDLYAVNYNCQGGKAAPERCSLYYHPGFLGVGSTLHTLSEDAGLMQINSGGWPAPQRAAKWARLGLLPNPFSPTKNIAAGVDQLAGEYAASGQLQATLEEYNSGKSAGDAAYAAAVRAWLTQWEQPQLHVWTLDFIPRQTFVSPLNPVAVVVTASAPLGPAVPVVWAEQAATIHRTCRTTTTTTPGVPHAVTVRGPGGQTVTRVVTGPPAVTTARTCTARAVAAHPVRIPLQRVYDPTSVTLDGQPMVPAGGTGIGVSGIDPLYPGAGAWVTWVTRAGTYTVAARWPGGLTRTRTVMVAGTLSPAS